MNSRLLTLGLIAGWIIASWSPLPALAGDAGAVKGRVTFKGGREALKDEHKRMVIDTDAADKNCAVARKGDPLGSEDVIVQKSGDGGGLSNVLVSIKEGLGDKKFDVPSEPIVLDQKGCHYEPHVLGIMVGQKLLIRNSDPTSHNIHGLPKSNEEFNFSQPKQGMEKDHIFTTTEVFKVKCDVHPWMGCYVGVFTHPFFAVTGKDGSFEIKNVPPGEYTLEYFHEVFGTKTAKVKVTAGGTVEAPVEFSY